MKPSGRTERWLASGSDTCRSGFLKSERSSQSVIVWGFPGGPGVKAPHLHGRGSIPSGGTNISRASQCSYAHQKAPPLSAVLLGPAQLAFPPQGGGCGMLSRGALASECGPRDWGPSPKSRWGGWPATNPLRVLRDDLCLGQRNQKLARQGWGGKLLFCYPQADSRWNSSENLELT